MRHGGDGRGLLMEAAAGGPMCGEGPRHARGPASGCGHGSGVACEVSSGALSLSLCAEDRDARGLGKRPRGPNIWWPGFDVAAPAVADPKRIRPSGGAGVPDALGAGAPATPHRTAPVAPLVVQLCEAEKKPQIFRWPPLRGPRGRAASPSPSVFLMRGP